jgi:hypothetical protein
MEQENIYWEGYHNGWQDAVEEAKKQIAEVMLTTK